MAKFKDLHLLLQEEQRALFGPDSLGVYGPTSYPAQDPGNEKAFIGWTTIYFLGSFPHRTRRYFLQK